MGKGGFSKVYKAHDKLLDRTVALKFFTSTDANKYNLLSEIQRVIGLDHPNLVRYYDVVELNTKLPHGEIHKTEIGVLEFMRGGELLDYVLKNPSHKILDQLLIGILNGLDFLHKSGIIHRDLKPQNILVQIVDGMPVAKLIDFGISKNTDSDGTASSILLGTVEFMAPEQFSPNKYGIDGKIGTNVDLWAFGVMVYELLTNSSLIGKRNQTTSPEEIMSKVLGFDFATKIGDVPASYRPLLQKCLVRNANERIKNAIDLLPFIPSNIVVPKAVPQNTMVMRKPVESGDEKSEPNEVASDPKAASTRSKRQYMMIAAMCMVSLVIGIFITSILHDSNRSDVNSTTPADDEDPVDVSNYTNSKFYIVNDNPFPITLENFAVCYEDLEGKKVSIPSLNFQLSSPEVYDSVLTIGPYEEKLIAWNINAKWDGSRWSGDVIFYYFEQQSPAFLNFVHLRNFGLYEANITLNGNRDGKLHIGKVSAKSGPSEVLNKNYLDGQLTKAKQKNDQKLINGLTDLLTEFKN